MFVKEITVMNFENYFPLWNDLNTAQKKIISDNLITRDVKKGTIIHNGNLDCTGLLLVKSGQLRTYILSDEGREITLYRLFDMDMCLLSSSCIIRSIQFEVTIEAEKDTDLWIIPAEIYKDIMKESAPVANYTNELMATRFSDVMWLIFNSFVPSIEVSSKRNEAIRLSKLFHMICSISHMTSEKRVAINSLV